MSQGERSDPGLILELTTGPPANGGSCVARHDGRVVFVRYALPGETVRVGATATSGGRAERGLPPNGEAIGMLRLSR